MPIRNRVRPIAYESLPEGYRRCEYLESTGTQYIIANFAVSQYAEYECVVSVPALEGFGYLGFNSSGDLLATTGNSWQLQHTIPVSPDTLVTARLKCVVGGETTGSVNGEYLGSRETKATSFSRLIVCGAYETLILTAKIYSCKIWTDDGLVYNLIPALDPNNRPCMYDTVSRKPFYNQGASVEEGGKDFLYKLKVPDARKLPYGYYPLEYLESTGTQWIDTGIKLSNESDFKITCEFSASEADGIAHYAFGVNSASVACYAVLPTHYAPHFYLNGTNVYFIGVAQRCVIEYTNNHVIINGVKKIFSNAGEAVTTTENIAVFSCRLGGFPLIGRFYSFSISRAGVLQLDLQPCLNANGEPVMYDFVSGKDFKNLGTGVFLYKI